MLPMCGVTFMYGQAEVINIFSFSTLHQTSVQFLSSRNGFLLLKKHGLTKKTNRAPTNSGSDPQWVIEMIEKKNRELVIVSLLIAT
jgi:hypothetical protein